MGEALWMRFESGKMYVYGGDTKGPDDKVEKVDHKDLEPKPSKDEHGKEYEAALSYYWMNPNCIWINGREY